MLFSILLLVTYRLLTCCISGFITYKELVCSSISCIILKNEEMKIRLENVLKERKTTVEEAFKLFDELEPATLDFMIGRWKGISINSGHRLDGKLEHSGWYGKVFFNLEEVHPLLYFTEDKTAIYSVEPTSLFGRTEHTGKEEATRVFEKTKEAKARLRNTEYRGRSCATMVYDELPILDVFVKIDDTKVLGVMDLKGDPEPFFFVLERDNQSTIHLDV